ncbi:HK97 gp10 family phage protein [Bradyrhizobium prioriisuperbiae]|uniref:HK97 gp10 family phage protein n=1 Tax=Bradyrhizobium prioriisuperbiae TaxID=2854389 RepID=UPI0028E41D1E|nr:HK97 gp10 family phage protein [Bradyrhizobium prioritasuperba]
MAGGPDDDVQSWFDELPYKLKREIATKIKEQADYLKSEIQDAAPRGDTGNLAKSVVVRRKRNELDFEVTAGGDLTTKFYNRSTGYKREVVIGSGDTEGIEKQKDGSGVSYDYAMAQEYGTRDEPAQPFFYSTARRLMPEIQSNIEDAVEEVISKA